MGVFQMIVNVIFVIVSPRYWGGGRIRHSDEILDLFTAPTRLDVGGESLYGKSFATICGNEVSEDGVSIVEMCRVIPEDDNKYDENAVRVELRGLTVGHLGRDNAKRYRQKYGMSVTECYASIKGGFVLGDGKRADYSVSLEFEL